LEDPSGAIPQNVKQQAVQPDTISMEIPTTPREVKEQTNKL
jgi:hypothetical protein